MALHRLFPRQLRLAATFAALSGLISIAAATPLQDSQQYLKQGQFPQALEQVDKHLSDNPKDAQGRFLRGVILTEMGRTQDAISVFNKLTEDYPALPEPYNNLAVIYAQQKQYDKAKQALEKAIRTHPAYATAHENLGDIYARLASQAYDKALQLDSSNSTAQTKLSMIRDLIGTASRPGSGRPATPPAIGPIAAAPVVAPTPVAAPKPVEAPKPVPAPVTPPPAVKPVPTPAPVAAPTPAAPPVAAAKPAKPAAEASNNDDVARAINAWAAAWSKKDVKGYLSHYAKDFKTPGGVSRNAWETERNQRIKKPGNIQVGVDGLKVSIEGGDHATVRFRQHYKSASLTTSSGKTLVLVKRDGKWLIQQERIGG